MIRQLHCFHNPDGELSATGCQVGLPPFYFSATAVGRPDTGSVDGPRPNACIVVTSILASLSASAFRWGWVIGAFLTGEFGNEPTAPSSFKLRW